MGDLEIDHYNEVIKEITRIVEKRSDNNFEIIDILIQKDSLKILFSGRIPAMLLHDIAKSDFMVMGNIYPKHTPLNSTDQNRMFIRFR